MPHRIFQKLIDFMKCSHPPAVFRKKTSNEKIFESILVEQAAEIIQDSSVHGRDWRKFLWISDEIVVK